ncbi:MAG TPA: universal stress protein [Gaiellaceae bacterium]|nr:universal stress protein [Gaiellaceae bacterium]
MAADSIFARILVGVDGSEAGYEACRQAARLAGPESAIEAVAVVDLSDAFWAAHNAPAAREQLERDAEAALEQAAGLLGARARTRLVDGPEGGVLLHEAERTAATLVAVGWHGHPRIEEILIGGVVGELLHTPVCSVLVARPAGDPDAFPRSVAVGFDGSPAAGCALDTGEHLAATLRIPLRVITATPAEDLDLEPIRQRYPSVEEIDGHPVDALVGASEQTDLLVVGSRGLSGLRALGSVSERVAHEAACSVLVVRPPREG